jgi:hypothetical protein
MDNESPLLPGTWIKVLVGACNETCVQRWHHGIVTEVIPDNDCKIIHVQYDNENGTHKVVETSLGEFMCEHEPLVVDAEPAFDPRIVVQRARAFLGKQDCDLPVRNMERLACYIYCGTANLAAVDW